VQVGRLRRGGRPAAARAARLTAAAVASWLLAVVLFPGSQPLLAPLTALLVVQATPISLLVSGLDRVVSVVAGVLVAVGFAAVVDLTWWSLGLAVALSILVGQALRLGANLLEVPISAMLVMGVGFYSAEAAAGQRIAETLVGAAVGVVLSLLMPPRIGIDDAGAAVRDAADQVADLLDAAGRDLAALRPGRSGFGQHAARWLDVARRLTYDMAELGARVQRAEQSRRLNLRALAVPDTGPGLRQSMEALEHTVVAVRSMFRSFADSGGAHTWGEDVEEDDLHADIRAGTSLALHEQAAAVRAFGRLVAAEAQPSSGPPDGAVLREALDGLLEARARLTDLTLVDDSSSAELNTALLVTVRRLLVELDLDARLRRLEGPRPGGRRDVLRSRAAALRPAGRR